jgi:3-keto-disaccharide hydrolase
VVLTLSVPAAAQEPRPYGDLGDLAIARPEDRQDVPVVPPPSGALVLFDGEDLDQWVKTDGKSAPAWELVERRAMQVTPRGGSLITKQKFDGHFKLHIEFRVPYMPEAQGQARGNSGVYLQGRYEVQILDSYGLKSSDNDCGGIYKVAIPKINACKAPTVWQSYDIDFRAPRFADGKKVEPARISVLQNGVPIHEDVAIPIDNTTAGLGGDPGQPGPIMLQDHGNPVQYRNIWLLPLSR